MKPVTSGVIGLAIGVLATGLLSKSCADRALAELQAHSDTAVANVKQYADSLRRASDSLAQRQVRVVTVVRQDTAAAHVARQALAIAKTARDSNVALVGEVTALRSANAGLFEALALAQTEAATERMRGDSLERVVVDLGRRIAKLKPRPKWFTVSLRVVELVAAVKGGYEWGKAVR